MIHEDEHVTDALCLVWLWLKLRKHIHVGISGRYIGKRKVSHITVFVDSHY
jgi:hypothetical protein